MTMNAQDIDALQARFQSHLPQYATLWRSMIQNNKKQTTKRREPLSLLTAIENKTTVTINAKTQHQVEGEDCDNCKDCSPPTYEELFVEAHCLSGSNSPSPSQCKLMIASEGNNSNDPNDTDESESDATQDTQPTVLRIKKPHSRESSSSSDGSPSSRICHPISFDMSGMEHSTHAQKGVDNFLGLLDFENLNLLETRKERKISSDDEHGYSYGRNNLRNGHEYGEGIHIDTQSTRENNQLTFAERRCEVISTPQEVKVEQQEEKSDDSSSGSTVVHFDISFLMDHDANETTTPCARASEVNSVTRVFLLPQTTPPTQDLFGNKTHKACILSPVPPNNQTRSDDDLVDTPSPQPDARKSKSRAKARIVIESSSEDDSRDSTFASPWLVSDKTDAEYGDENSWQNSSQGGSEVENDTDDGKLEPAGSRDRDIDDFNVLTSDSDSNNEQVDNNDHILTSETKPIPRKSETLPRNKTTSFRRNRDALTKSAFDEFNTKVFNGSLVDVKFQWSNKLRTTGGMTHLKRLINIESDPTYFATIDLSEKVLDEEHRMRSTLLHEMCHAATWIIDHVAKPAHGSVFKKWGSYARKKTGILVSTTHSYAIQYKFAWACQTPKCEVVIQRHSRSVDTARHVCGRCKGKLIEIDAPQKGAKKSDIIKTPKKKVLLSGYNLFVKQTSRDVRERLTRERKQEDLNEPKVTQSDVLKECARLWKQTKTIMS